MRFIAIDFETANADLASICQAGLCIFEEDRLLDTWATLIDPEDEFDDVNVGIHGITEEDVSGAPTFAEAHATLREYLTDQLVVCHTHFDRTALAQATDLNELEPILCDWLDTARVARRAWPQYAQAGYGLANVARDLGIEFKHHDAREDARAAGEILLRAVAETGLPLDAWPTRVTQPIDAAAAAPTRRDGNPDGSLYGETLVFTGSLSLVRRDAADLAARAGCNVASGVTKKTTMLVVGDQDIRALGGRSRSSKHMKALRLIEKGQSLRILSQKDFQRIVEMAN